MADVDYWGQAVVQVRRLQGAVVALAVAVAALSVAVLLPILAGTPVHYIPPGGPGVSLPGVIPDEAATDYASRWLVVRYSFTEATVRDAHREVAKGLHPTMRTAFEKQAEQEVLVVKEHQLATQLTMRHAQVLGRAGEEVRVQVQAVRAIYVGKALVREEEVAGELGVLPWVAQGHPRGLVISRIKLSPSLGVTGQ